MDTGSFVAKLIVYVDNDVIANVGAELRTRPFPVDPYDWSCKSTVRIGDNPSDIPVVGDRCSEGKLGSKEESKKTE